MKEKFMEELKNNKEEMSYRYSSFSKVFESLIDKKKENFFIVETGVLRVPEKKEGRKLWGDGQSTYLFDLFVQTFGGSVVTVDINPKACEVARSIVSKQTSVICGDAVQVLSKLSQSDDLPEIDLLYLDSFDADWNAPHKASLHHLKELCCIYGKLKDGALILVDDCLYFDGKQGKGLYVADFLENIGAELIHEGYQFAWKVKKNKNDFSSILNSLSKGEEKLIDVFNMENPVLKSRKLISSFSNPPFIAKDSRIKKGGELAVFGTHLFTSLPMNLRKGNYKFSICLNSNSQQEKFRLSVKAVLMEKEYAYKEFFSNQDTFLSFSLPEDLPIKFDLKRESTEEGILNISLLEFERMFSYSLDSTGRETLEKQMLKNISLLPKKNLKKLLAGFLSPIFIFNLFIKSLTRKKKYKKDVQAMLD